MKEYNPINNSENDQSSLNGKKILNETKLGKKNEIYEKTPLNARNGGAGLVAQRGSNFISNKKSYKNRDEIYKDIPKEIREKIPSDIIEKIPLSILADRDMQFKIANLDDVAKNLILEADLRIFEGNPELIKRIIITGQSKAEEIILDADRKIFEEKPELIKDIIITGQRKQYNHRRSQDRTNIQIRTQEEKGCLASVWSCIKSVFSCCKPKSLEDVDHDEIVRE